MNIERSWWFKVGVGVLTVISALALFSGASGLSVYTRFQDG